MIQKNTVNLGDCLELMNHVEDKSIDMILCDLPYGITSCKWDSVIPLDKLWVHYKRIIRDNGVIVLTGSQPFTSQLVMSNPNWFKYEVIWEKNNCSNYMNANKIVMKVHENILIFYKNKPIYNPQKYFKGICKRLEGVELREGSPVYRSLRRIDYQSNDGMRYPRSVQKINSEKGLHPTQKPVKLFEWLIKTYTNEGMTVLDNCAGSGTTAIACINSNRNYILMEQDESYVATCNERIAQHTSHKNNQPNIPIEQLDIHYGITQSDVVNQL